MGESFRARKRIRKTFGRIPEVTVMPNLIEVQRQSYEGFLQRDVAAGDRTLSGLEEVFRSVFPIKDFADRAALDFVKYELEDPKYDVEECHQRGMTYAAPLRVTLRLIVWDVDEETGSRSVRDIKEQDVYMGDMPLMTANGTFVINGTERVIVSQMHRSPGVFFDHDRGKTHSSGKYLFSARDHPLSRLVAGLRVRRQGSRLCAHRPAPQAAGDDALPGARPRSGGRSSTVLPRGRASSAPARAGSCRSAPIACAARSSSTDLVDAKTGETLAEAGTKMTPAPRQADRGAGRRARSTSPPRSWSAASSAAISIDEATGLVLAEAGQELTGEVIRKLTEAGVEEIPRPRHRSPDDRPLYPQHAHPRSQRQPRGGAARHLPGAASRASRRRWIRPRPSSTASSSTSSATTSRRSAASR